jgi:hypothetical protein
VDATAPSVSTAGKPCAEDMTVTGRRRIGEWKSTTLIGASFYRLIAHGNLYQMPARLSVDVLSTRTNTYGEPTAHNIRLPCLG